MWYAVLPEEYCEGFEKNGGDDRTSYVVIAENHGHNFGKSSQDLVIGDLSVVKCLRRSRRR